jgi:hypothetical protein
MMREILVMISQGRSKQRFGGLSRALVQQLTAFGKQRVVGDLLCQRMLENVFDSARGRLFIDEFAL